MSSATPPPEDGSAGNAGINNVAQDSATVEAQIGVVEGDAVFHRHETTYHVANSDSAERKYRVARNHLDGGIPRVAENLIGQALDAGFATTEVAYYYAISVLSGRSLNELGPNELDKLDRAVVSTERFVPDEWCVALEVISNLVTGAIRLDGKDGSLPPDGPHVVLDRFQEIGTERRAEITRHMDMILNGAIQDRLDRLNAATVEAERRNGNRIGRAWKYFHPDPTEPRRARPVPLERGRAKSIARAQAVSGTAGFGVTLALSVQVSESFGPLVVPLIWLLLGAAIAVWHGSLVSAADIRRRMKMDLDDLPDPQDKAGESNDDLPAREKLADQIARRIRYYFSPKYVNSRYSSRPITKANKESWKADTRGVKSALYARLVRLYAHTKVQPATLNWLIRWHAKQAVDDWRSGKLVAKRDTLRSGVPSILLLCLGIVIVGVGAALLIDVAWRIGLALTVVSIFEVTTGCVGAFGIAKTLGHRMAMAQEHEELTQLFNKELREYERWRERLSDRPRDAEIAGWLEYDKSYLKTRAIQKCGLRSRDIIAHIVLTEGRRTAKRARVAHGPPRFSKYVVLVFLLTGNGVREVGFDLDFETAAIYDEWRIAFGYGSLASVNVLETGFQSVEQGQRHVVRMGSEVRLTDKSSLVLGRVLRLVLVNQQDISIVVNNYEGLLDDTTGEDESRLDSAALDSSGLVAALRILEAVAAEGREWIAWERDLRTRRWREWQRSRMGRLQLGGPPGPRRIEFQANRP